MKHIKCNCHLLLICTFMTVTVESHPQKGAIKIKSLKKQPFRGVLTSEKISENMQQIYRTPMPKCDFNKSMGVLLQICCIFSEHLFLRTPLDGCFCTSC